MTVSRREFLKAGTMVSLSAVIPVKSAFGRRTLGSKSFLGFPPEAMLTRSTS